MSHDRVLSFTIFSKRGLDAEGRFLVSYTPVVHRRTLGEIAQLVERRTHKPKVKGSIPFLATISPPFSPLGRVDAWRPEVAAERVLSARRQFRIAGCAGTAARRQKRLSGGPFHPPEGVGRAILAGVVVVSEGKWYNC